VIRGCNIFWGQKLANTCSNVGGRIIAQQEKISRAERSWTNPLNEILSGYMKFSVSDPMLLRATTIVHLILLGFVRVKYMQLKIIHLLSALMSLFSSPYIFLGLVCTLCFSISGANEVYNINFMLLYCNI